MKKLTLALLLVASIGAFVLYHYGRSLWFPFYVRLTGGQTVEEGVRRIKEKGIGIGPELIVSLDRLVLLGLKEEKVLEVWGQRDGFAPIKLKEFPFTGYSGSLGPKLREGDGQIPEGIYKIDYLNPNSSFCLSMKLNYPNEFDREKGKEDGREDLGYDIFIHGGSATIGCIPIGDEEIEELFLLVSEVGKENVIVILSPYDMRIKEKQIEIEGIAWESELYDTIRATIENRIPQQDGALNVANAP
jgi:hypothetical protein